MTLHKDLGPNLTAVVLVTGLFAFISMGLRTYVRVTKRSWGLEDWIMAVGCLPLLTLTIVTTIGSYYGIGAKDATFALPGNQKYVETAYFWFFLYELFYCTSIIFVKLSIAFMLNRIAGRRMVFIYINYGIMALCASTNLAAILYIIFQCDPVEAAWKADLMAKGTHCQPSVYLMNVYYFCTSVNIFTDWATALMPIALLWNVQMNRNTKISVGGILGLGIFTSVSGLVRLKYTVALTSRENYLYGLAQILIWGYAEPALGMLVGNIATLRPLFQRMLNLGSSGSEQPYSDESPRGISNGNRSHPYQSFDPELELGTVIDPKDDQMPAVRIRGGRSSAWSDCESQKQILEKGDEALPMSRNRDEIVVSQHVEVTRE
ncbi:hypothetical protein DDE82_008422 [Stemphylium lycopersici]|uniref:Rhodopsin domain-containing protein n=1 Tax=Stemphylium lycopersici TaxID=183478 RepID=A0A364MUV1_STELY|nr:hypothetical protein TW65_03507 [Stemphylium lycopersici]RAQ99282.1 hypothetical protein DDE82_008422 [Stemphylium lycopersici]RAR04281.1 hypothetical protein DDE83_007894 [Stemphylium lycopersici]